jgi:hypothetical protein
MRTGRLLIILFVLILIVVGMGGYVYSRHSIIVNKNKRQVVYMSNGQVYFGNLDTSSGQYIELRDAYYPATEQTTTSGKSVTLKPISEDYSAENIIYLNRDQILFYENLADSSKINDAIQRFKSSVTTSPTPTP